MGLAPPIVEIGTGLTCGVGVGVPPEAQLATVLQLYAGILAVLDVNRDKELVLALQGGGADAGSGGHTPAPIRYSSPASTPRSPGPTSSAVVVPLW